MTGKNRSLELSCETFLLIKAESRGLKKGLIINVFRLPVNDCAIGNSFVDAPCAACSMTAPPLQVSVWVYVPWLATLAAGVADVSRSLRKWNSQWHTRPEQHVFTWPTHAAIISADIMKVSAPSSGLIMAWDSNSACINSCIFVLLRLDV